MDNDGGGRDDDEQSHWITSCSSRLYYYYKSHLYTTVYFLDYVPTVWNVWSILNVMVELLTSSRDIATALRSVFLSAGKVQGRPSLDPVYDEVRSNAQVVISNVGQLLQTLKSVEEDERRGIRSLELAANYCREQAKLLPSSKDPEGLLTPNSSRKSGPRSISVASGSSSLIARYLAPDDLARAAGGSVQSAVSKAILANNTQIQRDIVQTSSATRDAVTDLVAAAKCLLRYSDIPPETRSSCAIVTRELAEEFAVLLDALKNGLCIPRKSDPENVSKIARRIADISHSLINLVDSLREGPRLIMYFRASSPEWRDVAEKFIGRHVAYHHHYVSNYALGGGSKSSHKSIFIRPTCYPLQLSSEQTMNDEAECRIVDAIMSADNKLAQSLLVTARSVAVSVQNLIKTARTVISAPPSDAVDRARTAEGASQKSTSSAALWRTELNVSLATQHLCQLSKLCSETVPSTTSKKLENSTGELSGGLILSRERLLAAVRQVATTGAQLLLAAKLRKEALMSADIRKLKTAGQAVKESTDLLAETVQRGDTVSSSSTSPRIEITWPTYTNQALLQVNYIAIL
uniref:Talin-1 n=1 Tax=Schistosoma haematobium TaxID=6185 RepID=A0A095CBQ1_SCHHA